MVEPNPGAKEGLGVVSELMRPLIEQANALTAAVRQDGAERRRENRRVLVAVIGLLLLLLLNCAVLLQNRARSLQNGEVLRNSARTSELIADCTQPTGTCYQQNARRTQGLIQQIFTMNLYVEQCAKVTNTDGELEECVRQRMKSATPAPTPAPGPTPSAAQDGDVTP